LSFGRLSRRLFPCTGIKTRHSILGKNTSNQRIMEASPEEIVKIPTIVLADLMKKVRKQSREVKNLKRLVATLNETIRCHNQAWDDLYDRVAEMGEEIGNLTESMAYTNQNEEQQPQENALDTLSDAMTDEHLYNDLLDISS
jgi:hypothetical protein